MLLLNCWQEPFQHHDLRQCRSATGLGLSCTMQVAEPETTGSYWLLLKLLAVPGPAHVRTCHKASIVPVCVTTSLSNTAWIGQWL